MKKETRDRLMFGLPLGTCPHLTSRIRRILSCGHSSEILICRHLLRRGSFRNRQSQLVSDAVVSLENFKWSRLLEFCQVCLDLNHQTKVHISSYRVHNSTRDHSLQLALRSEISLHSCDSANTSSAHHVLREILPQFVGLI